MRKGQFIPIRTILRVVGPLVIGGIIFGVGIFVFSGQVTDAYSFLKGQLGVGQEIEPLGEASVCGTGANQCSEGLNCVDSATEDNIQRCCPADQQYVGNGCGDPSSRPEGAICEIGDQCGTLAGTPISEGDTGDIFMACADSVIESSVDGEGNPEEPFSGGRCCPEGRGAGVSDIIYVGGRTGCADQDTRERDLGIGAACNTETNPCRDASVTTNSLDDAPLECKSAAEGLRVNRCCPVTTNVFVDGTEGNECALQGEGERGLGAVCTPGESQCEGELTCVGSANDFAGTRCCPEGETYVGGETVCAEIEGSSSTGDNADEES